MSIRISAWVVCAVTLPGGAFAPLPASGGLVLEHDLYQDEVVEKSPLVVTLVVRNAGDEDVMTIFPQGHPEVLAERSLLVLRAPEGAAYRCDYRGGPHVFALAPTPEYVMRPGETRKAERVVSLLHRSNAPAGYEFVPSGRYIGRIEVTLLGGDALTSDEFSLTIKEAKGEDDAASRMVHVRHAAFLEGKDLGTDPAVFNGGRGPYGVDWTVFRELQDILERHPGSVYARWIEFWKLYQYGSTADARQFAKENPNFPLADNLLLRVARREFDVGSRSVGTAVLRQLIEDFPDSNACKEAAGLHSRLTGPQ
jgi:hypothetical protein